MSSPKVDIDEYIDALLYFTDEAGKTFSSYFKNDCSTIDNVNIQKYLKELNALSDVVDNAFELLKLKLVGLETIYLNKMADIGEILHSKKRKSRSNTERETDRCNSIYAKQLDITKIIGLLINISANIKKFEENLVI